MISNTFDDLVRLLGAGAARRRVLGGLSAALAAGLAPDAASAGCKKVGKRCDANKDCCDGARCRNGTCRCRGDRDECGGACHDLDRDEAHCGACDNRCADGETCEQGVCIGEGGCPAGADSCAGGESVLCGDNPDCVCVQTVSGETRCGDAATNQGFCGVCDTDADCETALGNGAFCVSATPEDLACCPLGSASNTCMMPCPVPGGL